MAAKLQNVSLQAPQVSEDSGESLGRRVEMGKSLRTAMNTH